MGELVFCQWLGFFFQYSSNCRIYLKMKVLYKHENRELCITEGGDVVEIQMNDRRFTVILKRDKN